MRFAWAALVVWTLSACPDTNAGAGQAGEGERVEAPAASLAPGEEGPAGGDLEPAPPAPPGNGAGAPGPQDAPEGPPPTPTEVSERGPAPTPPGLDRWIDARVREAHLAVRQFVRVPLVFRGPFGCDCPDHYIGVSPGMMDGGRFLILDNQSGEEFPEYDRQVGTVVMVDGYFGHGRVRYDGGDPSEPIFQHPFVITRIRGEPRRGALERARLLRLGGPQQCRLEVNDPASPLNVRARPASGAEVVATLEHRVELNPAEHRGSWTRIDAPAAGWVWTENTRVVCPASAAPAGPPEAER